MAVLYALVNGQWVPVSGGSGSGGGSEEVFVGPNDPGATLYELWYDTDATPSSSASTTPGRNLLDNGQMAVNQRGITSLPTGNGTMADRWLHANGGVGATQVLYVKPVSFGTNLPVGRPIPGYIQHIIMTTAEAAGALAAGDYMQWVQGIEGRFLQHLNWGERPDGSANDSARPLTLSFDVFSTIAATYLVELYRAETAVRTISKAFSVPAGWSTQALTFPGDTVTPITNDESSRLQVAFVLAAGSDYTTGAPKSVWGPTGSNRFVGVGNQFQATINNIFAVTNVQLEVGSTATPYEVRGYDQELAKCQRYYFNPGAGVPTANYVICGAGMATATTAVSSLFWLPVTMRKTPVLDMNGTTPAIYAAHDRIGGAGTVTAIAIDSVSTPAVVAVVWTTNAVLTVGRYYQNLRNAASAGCLGYSAEF